MPYLRSGATICGVPVDGDVGETPGVEPLDPLMLPPVPEFIDPEPVLSEDGLLLSWLG